MWPAEDAERDFFFARCSCGKGVYVEGTDLRSSKVQSCGCLQPERSSEANSIDLTGQRFGKLVVLERLGPTEYGDIQWKCKCDCGRETVALTYKLRIGEKRSCGCIAGKPGGFLELTGQRFGRLLVESLNEEVSRKEKRSFWNCICDCGASALVSSEGLTTGRTKSCGCLRSDLVAQKNMTHGMSNTRLYKIWLNMHQRCDNPNSDPEERYYFAGISYVKECERFEPFYEWATENGYRDDLTLDRINPFSDYSPKNCRWISLEQQASNTSNTYMRLVRETYRDLPCSGPGTSLIITFMQAKHDEKVWAGVFRDLHFDLLDLDSVERLQRFLSEYLAALYNIYVYRYCELTKCTRCAGCDFCSRKSDALNYLELHQSVFDKEHWPLPIVSFDNFEECIFKE